MTNPFAEFRERYEFNTPLFAEEVLGWDGKDGRPKADQDQTDIWTAIDNGERLISIRSGNGVGKTTTLAVAIVKQNVCIFPQKTVATAPSGGQLFDALAAETVTWLKKLPKPLYELFEVQSEGFFLRAAPEESFTSFRTSRAETPEALAGVHAEAGKVLIIADEASGVPDPVYQAASGSMSGRNSCTILAGNPTRLTGLFHDTHTKLRHSWWTKHISCVGHPRIAPEFIEMQRERYGEDSNAYRIHVLGEFPKADDDAVIPRDLMEAALDRKVVAVMVKPIWGIDVGGGGKISDRSTLVKRQGNVLLARGQAYRGLDVMQLCGKIKQEWDATMPSTRPSDILVDSIGLGAGVALRLQELGLPARGVNVSETPAMREQYVNLKAELWFKAREWFEARDCTIMGDIEMGEELCAVNYEPPTSSGKTKIEPKVQTKKRLGRSPDLGDAFVLTFATEAVSALMGNSGSAAWNEPLKRDICLV